MKCLNKQSVTIGKNLKKNNEETQNEKSTKDSVRISMSFTSDFFMFTLFPYRAFERQDLKLKEAFWFKI